MASSLSEIRFNAFIDLSRKYFSWEEILRDAGITQIADKNDQYEITCPFHEDKRPSMRLSKRTGVYHCFSCGRKGTYTKFLWELSGANVSYSNFCEQILKAHPAMQATLKFNSLFVSEVALSSEFNKRRVFNAQTCLGAELPITTLASRVRRMDDTWQNLVLSLTLLQQGVSADNVLTTVKKQHIDVDVPIERVSLNDII